MRKELAPEIERCRVEGEPNSGPHGIFSLLHPSTGRRLEVIVSDGRDWGMTQHPPTADEMSGMPPKLQALVKKKFANGPITFQPPVWEHVSVRVASFGMPRWEEMCWIKDVFWTPDEWVVQFHPAEKDYINDHSRVLHLWRVVGAEFPTPPKEAV